MSTISLRPDLIYPFDLSKNGKKTPDSTEYDWHLLAEGDSWFTIGAIPSSNLLLEMRFRKWTQILTLAYPGDTITHMGQLAKNKDLSTYLAKKRFNYKFDALLLSGGGNDLIDAASMLINKKGTGSKADDFIDQKRLGDMLIDIQSAYGKIIQLRDSADSLSQGAPTFVHTYDYCTPRDAPARFVGTVKLLGPWLFKAFKGGTVEPKMQQLIADRIIDRLAEALKELDSNSGKPTALPNFHVIDTRNTLVRANATEVGNSNDWLNEIHPNLDGYRKIANVLSARVNQALA
jgi:hypothetical protein